MRLRIFTYLPVDSSRYAMYHHRKRRSRREVPRLRKRLRSVREHHGMTQAQVADRVGISRHYYAEIESGRRRPSAPVMLQISAVLDADPRYLFADMMQSA